MKSTICIQLVGHSKMHTSRAVFSSVLLCALGMLTGSALGEPVGINGKCKLVGINSE